MNRRDFIKASSMIVAGGSLIPASLKSASGKSDFEENFSLEVITDKADKASLLLESFAKYGNLGNSGIKFAEYPVGGDVIGDLVLVKSGRLFDFINSTDEMSAGLKEIRSSLGLPSLISNPVRLRLFRNEGQNAGKIFIMRNGLIIKHLDPQSYGNFKIEGKSGMTIISVQKTGVSISDSECKYKICKQMKPIRRSGEYITCIPNELHIFAE